jgi:ABC-2 type transport system permease protein
MIHLVTNPIGVLALAKREIYRFLSVAYQTIAPPLLSSILFMYIFGVAIGSRVDFSATGLSYLQFIIPGLMGMHLISSSYENTSSSLFIGRWHNHIQEILLAPLSYIEIVLGLLAGGVARGILVCMGVWLVSLLFTPLEIAHPLALLYFMLTIAVIFSCAGMIGALWAEDFGMLSTWNTYVIMPLALLGGVFHPLFMLPKACQIITHFNPMYYLISGIRYSMTSVTDTPASICAAISLGMAGLFFVITVYLFKIGYKLRT